MLYLKRGDNMSFPEQLKRARIAAGLTQQEVADAMGITNSTYCGYETGKRQPDVQKIKQLSCILGVSGDDLLETGYKNTPTSYDGRAFESNTGKNLIKIAGRDGSFREIRLTDDQMKALNAFIDLLPEVPDDP